MKRSGRLGVGFFFDMSDILQTISHVYIGGCFFNRIETILNSLTFTQAVELQTGSPQRTTRPPGAAGADGEPGRGTEVVWASETERDGALGVQLHPSG